MVDQYPQIPLIIFSSPTYSLLSTGSKLTIFTALSIALPSFVLSAPISARLILSATSCGTRGEAVMVMLGIGSDEVITVASG